MSEYQKQLDECLTMAVRRVSGMWCDGDLQRWVQYLESQCKGITHWVPKIKKKESYYYSKDQAALVKSETESIYQGEDPSTEAQN